MNKLTVKSFNNFRRFVFTLLLITLVSSIWSMENDKEVPAWVNRVLFDAEGNEIWEFIADALPPADFRMPAVDVEQAQLRREVVIIDDVPTFDWCYGCANTSAAMMMGYYDRNGYSNMYAGPTNGGVCPSTNLTWGWGESPLSATHQGYDGLNVRGHVDDYYVYSGYEGEDPWMTGGWDPHDWADCTGDYMGTSQYSLGAHDGGTLFYIARDGSRLHGIPEGEGFRDRDGCTGMANFVTSREYNAADYYTSQAGGVSYFTFMDYMAEIDAGRPVMIFVANDTAGHAMLGVGYDSSSNDIYLHDTWDWSTHTMEWGGEYSGMEHYAVCCLELSSNIVEADFEAEELHVLPNEVVEFSDQSSGYPTGYEWDFENDGTIDSEERNPEWEYENSGIYSVSLRVYNWDTEDVMTRVDYIIVNTPPEFNLPGSFGFESGASLSIDLGEYSLDADGDDYTLSVSGMQDIMLEQDGFELTITAPENYTGSEVWEFTIDDGFDTSTGYCTIIVYPAGGAIIHVPDDYSTIQAAIDAAGHGYMVIVRPGTYTENIYMGDHEIQLGSMYLETGDRSYINQTIIYGDGDDVVTISEGNIYQELAGFTITHSAGGSAIRLGDRPAYIHDMKIYYNMAAEGAGIYIENGEPLIEYITFYENYLTGDGGAVYCEDAEPILRNLTFFNNYGDEGSAISGSGNSNITAMNLIIWGNDEDAVIMEDNANINIIYSDLEEFLEGEGNISIDPMFADAGNYDLHLQEGSPCIDAGNPDTDGDGIEWETDIDDQDADGSRKDMGSLPYGVNQGDNDEIIAGNTIFVYPNPFYAGMTRGDISIRYDLSYISDNAELKIFNVKGQLLESIKIPGRNGVINWDCKDTRGEFYSSGVYLVKIEGSGKSVFSKFLMLR